jgi:hypothetical protein
MIAPPSQQIPNRVPGAVFFAMKSIDYPNASSAAQPKVSDALAKARCIP